MERSNARYVYHGVRRIVTVPFNYWHEPVWTSSAGLQFVRLISKYKDFIVRLNGFFSLQVTVLPLFRCFCNRREHRRPMMYENPQKELFLVMCKNIAQTPQHASNQIKKLYISSPALLSPNTRSSDTYRSVVFRSVSTSGTAKEVAPKMYC
jgi:hypothetical protein